MGMESCPVRQRAASSSAGAGAGAVTAPAPATRALAKLLPWTVAVLWKPLLCMFFL